MLVAVDDPRRVAIFSDDLRRKREPEPEQTKPDGEDNNS